MPLPSPRVITALCCAIMTVTIAACGDSPTGPDAAPTPGPAAVSARRVFTYSLASSDSTAFGAALLDVAAAGGGIDSVVVAGGTTEQFDGRTLIVMPSETRATTLRVVTNASVTGVTVAVREIAGGDGTVGSGAGSMIVEPVK